MAPSADDRAAAEVVSEFFRQLIQQVLVSSARRTHFGEPDISIRPLNNKVHHRLAGRELVDRESEL